MSARAASLAALRREICRCECAVDAGDPHARCPIGRWRAIDDVPAAVPESPRGAATPPGARPTAAARHGPALWAELHRRPWVCTDLAAEPRWLRGPFAESLRALGCDCRTGWLAALATCPPLFETREDYFEWTVRVHNLKNAELGKALMTLSTALALYAPPG